MATAMLTGDDVCLVYEDGSFQGSYDALTTICLYQRDGTRYNNKISPCCGIQDELIESLRSEGRRQAAHRMLKHKRDVTHGTTDEEPSGSAAE
jgi:hypothetical protein